MKAQTFSGCPGYFFILAGMLLSVLAAVVPFFNDGYVLQFSIFLAGVLPWLVYVIVVQLMPGTLSNICGVLLVVAQGWLVVAERYMGNADYSNNFIYLVPIILSILLLPLVFMALVRGGQSGS